MIGDDPFVKAAQGLPLGKTDTFPRGKISKSDEGALTIGVAFDQPNGLVRIEFGTPVAWLAMPPENAISFARAILKAAGAKKIEIEI